MRTLLKITYVLPCFFIGLIIGGAAVGNSAAWISGLVLLAADIVLGIFLQRAQERKGSRGSAKNKNTPELLTLHEQRYLARVARAVERIPLPDTSFSKTYTDITKPADDEDGTEIFDDDAFFDEEDFDECSSVDDADEDTDAI